MHQNRSLQGGEPDRKPDPGPGTPEDPERAAHEKRGGKLGVRRHRRPETPLAEQGNDGALAFMAHELRTPLSAIIGLADLLRDSQLSEDQRDMIDIMGRSARALVEIVNGVLDLEKLQAGKLQLEHRTFSPGDCVEECVSLLAASAAQKRVDLAFFIDETVPSLIKGDDVRLRQTLINLLGNALKFTEVGQVVVSVTATPWTAGRCELRFTVADSGPGIPVEQQSAIFEPYAQADVSTSRRFGGTGLGLPITKRLVALMGGRLWIKSEIGLGSTFNFTLPAELDTLAGVRARGRDAGLAGRRLLVVEDNPVVGELLVAELRRWDVDATLVTDLPSAVAALSNGTFSLALIDGEMPGITARAVALALRSLVGQSGLPLVLMTSLGVRSEATARSLDAGDGRFTAYVTKPVRPARLHDALVQALAGGPVDASAAPAAAPARTAPRGRTASG